MAWISITPKEVTYILFVENDSMPVQPAAQREHVEKTLRTAGIQADVHRVTGEITVAHGRVEIMHDADKTAYLWIMPAEALRSQPLPKLHDFITRDPYPDLPHFPDLGIKRKPQHWNKR